MDAGGRGVHEALWRCRRHFRRLFVTAGPETREPEADAEDHIAGSVLEAESQKVARPIHGMQQILFCDKVHPFTDGLFF